MTIQELYYFYPDSLNQAAAWLVSGLISTESELIALTLRFEAIK